MKTPVQSIGQLLDGAQRRFTRSRAGSVLILVVALLVLMALIGTAYMTMAQFDRAAAVQHTFNTEVDMLLDGVINQVKGIVTGELFVSGNFHNANPAYNTVGTFPNFDSLGPDSGTATALAGGAYTPNPGTWWLASRVPDLYPFLNPAGIGPNFGTWGFVTGPINGSGTFDTPYWPPKPAPNSPPLQYSVRNILVPGISSVSVDGQNWPSWQNLSSSTSPPQIPVGYTSGQIIAADADGDGIADSGLVKLLTLDGITYYTAIRIVDNCAAINASIATRPNPATALTPATGPQYTAMPGDFSPVNLDLEGMLVNPTPELYQGLLPYRFSKLATGPQTGGVDEFGNPRSDFNFMPDTFGGINLSYHQQWSQLGRRLENPSYISGGGATKFQALSNSESMIMARDFILRDPSTPNSNSSSSTLEQTLTQTAFGMAPTTAYTPGNVSQWFFTNFNYFPGANSAAPPYNASQPFIPSQMPMRPLLVSRNQVSNFIPSKFTDKGNYAGNGYLFGDMVTYNGHRYVCINPNPANPPIEPALDNVPNWPDPNWAYEPWTSAPTKADANTATFQQLYAAYWGVMADHLSAAAGGGWGPQWDTTNGAGRMFRSPIRAAGAAAGTQLTPQQVMYLRAALAAVNTMDLRDGDDDVTSRTITIPPSTTQGGTPLQATVFGAEKEPYITQIYARNDQQVANDFVAIEIYNPFPATTAAISLSNWQFVAYNRTSHTVTQIAPMPGTVPAIPGQTRFVFVSNTAVPPTVVTGIPTSNVFQVTGLDTKGLANEVFLMRPRSATGNFSTSPLLNNSFSEGNSSAGLAYLVPVDCYDFTNLPVAAPDEAHATEWHYVRPNDPSQGKAWHFVYPGPWNSAAVAPAPTEGGTAYASAGATPLPPLDVSPLGQPQAKVAAIGDLTGAPGGKVDMTYMDVPLQVANVNFGGPLKFAQPPGAPTTGFFPYGGFARNGDLLQVTFIGSYIITQAPAAGSPAGTAPTIIEMNPITMDSSMATANDTSPFQPLGTSALAAENIGRFCPVDPNDASGVNDYLLAPSGSTQNPSWRYQWTTRLFDYLTVLSPQDDYTPQYTPWRPEPSDPSYTSHFNYTPANTNANMAPQAVGNTTPTVKNSLRTTAPPTYNTANATEETAAINGLVNINSAPWRVLAAVPWVPATDGQYQTKNAAIAKAIVRYRDVDDGSGANPKHGHGPFRSIFELSDIAVGAPVNATIRNADGNTSAGNSPTQLAQYGDIIQVGQTTAGQTAVTGDFETQFLTLNRVSNLITTRSDSFTAYILIQGWRNAETTTPSLVVQRRAAILLDRSAVTPRNTSPTVINIPMD